MSDPSNEIRKRFAQKLTLLRERAGYRTRRAFARAIGIDENRYTRYERAEVEPNLQLLVTIADGLKASPNALLGYIGEPQSSLGAHRAPGFADDTDARDPLAPPRDDVSRDRVPGATNPILEAACWKLADHVAHLDPPTGDDGAARLKALQAASAEYKALMADPFGRVAQLVADDRVMTSSDAHKDAIATLAEDVIRIATGGA